jgi:hypothetical protein
VSNPETACRPGSALDAEISAIPESIPKTPIFFPVPNPKVTRCGVGEAMVADISAFCSLAGLPECPETQQA